MKYVIELPEYIKHEVDIDMEEDVDKAEDLIRWYSATLTCAIKDSTPLQTEFEEIKADIDDMLKSDEVKNDKWANIIINKSYLFKRIINNHISELKGE